MMPFETDKLKLLEKLKEISEDYITTIEADHRFLTAKRKMREMKKVIKSIDKWSIELKAELKETAI